MAGASSRSAGARRELAWRRRPRSYARGWRVPEIDAKGPRPERERQGPLAPSAPSVRTGTTRTELEHQGAFLGDLGVLGPLAFHRWHTSTSRVVRPCAREEER